MMTGSTSKQCVEWSTITISPSLPHAVTMHASLSAMARSMSKFKVHYDVITASHDLCVYSDLMENPLIVPVKVLRGHTPVNALGMSPPHNDCVYIHSGVYTSRYCIIHTMI